MAGLIDIDRRVNLSLYEGEDRVISVLDLKTIIENTPITRRWTLYSGIERIDQLIDGFKPGEVTVLSGITGEGKTTFCQTLTHNFYGLQPNGISQKSIWFSYEVRPELFISKFGNVLPEYFTPLILKEKSLEWIEERIAEGICKHNIRAVFIDHLHYLLDLTRAFNVSIQIGDLMRHMVNIAHDLQIHLFLIAHMTKVSPDKEPGKGDARDSSFVEQEADNVFYIWRKHKIPNGAKLKIVKNRRNGVFNETIHLIYKDFRMLEDKETNI